LCLGLQSPTLALWLYQWQAQKFPRFRDTQTPKVGEHRTHWANPSSWEKKWIPTGETSASEAEAELQAPALLHGSGHYTGCIFVLAQWSSGQQSDANTTCKWQPFNRNGSSDKPTHLRYSLWHPLSINMSWSQRDGVTSPFLSLSSWRVDYEGKNCVESGIKWEEEATVTAGHRYLKRQEAPKKTSLSVLSGQVHPWSLTLFLPFPFSNFYKT
jgi:hypothetical protein